MPAHADHEREQQLRARLAEDLAAPDAAVERAIIRFDEVRGPGAEADRLARMLAAVRRAQDTEAALAPPAHPAVSGQSLWRAVRSQLSVVRLPLICTAILILVLGMVLGPLWLQPICTPLFVLAPPIAVLGVGYAFRALDGGMAEIECACPVRPIELALSRLVVVVGCDILLAVLLLPFNAGRVLPGGGGLILDWLAPLLLASGVTLLVIQRLSSRLAVEIGMIVWLSFVALHVLIQSQTVILTQATAGSLGIGASAIGLACLVAGVALFDRRGLQGASR
jgi:hypothetical protein